MNHSWMSPIIRRLNSVEKMQVFWPWSSLRMSACTVPRTVASTRARICAASASVGLRPVLGRERVQALVDGGVEEVGEDRRGRAVDRHRDRGGGRGQVEPVVEDLHVVQRRDRDAGGADLAVDVGALPRVAAVQGDGVERGRQPGGGLPLRHQLEPAVGAERVALPGEHPGRVLALALEREHPGREREVAGQVLLAQEPQQLAVVGVARQRHPGDLAAGQRLAGQRGAQLAVADPDHLLVAGVGLDDGGPGLDQRGAVLGDVGGGLVEERRDGLLGVLGGSGGSR